MLSGPFADALVRNVVMRIIPHDQPMRGAWLCGDCTYANVGPICTKCGGLRYDGQAFR